MVYMFDQSFSYDTINTVFMQSNRKGQVKKEFLSVEYLEVAKEYRTMRHRLNSLKKISKEKRTVQDKTEIFDLEIKMKENALEQKVLLKKHLSIIADNINKREFRFSLTSKPSCDPDKPNYLISKTPEEFFAMQVLCKNLKHTFNLHMTGRNDMLLQVKQLLKEDKHEKYIIRTDIQHCFESIPHKQLFELIDESTLLDYKNKAMLKGLICKEFEYKNLRRLVTTVHTGIPRGCAVSSYLAELYLSKIDKEIKREINNIVYYNRYVDDIIIIIHPSQAHNQNITIDEYKRAIEKIVIDRGLMLSPNKTIAIDTKDNTSYKFELLGYRFNVSPNGLSICHSGDKIKKMITRINALFMEFDSILATDYLNAKSYLFDALRILTANTNLHNNKKGIKIGAYYSNQVIDDSSALTIYDKYLAKKINQISLPISCFHSETERQEIENELKRVLLKNANFEKGFNGKKRFCINKQRLHRIKMSWV